MNLEFMLEAHRRTRKTGASGIDGQTAADYGENLEGNLQSLLDRAKSGSYRAPPVRRVEIPKGDGKETRPIGIPTFEDKVLQRAVTMLLEAVYEQDFLDCSYGFRPKRSPHQAIDAIWQKTMSMRGGWVVEVDIRRFFDTLDHGHIREILRQRVTDGVVVRLIGKWLNAGVMEDGAVFHPKAGTPQGGVISPLLANVYLHHVLDRWWKEQIQPRMRGESFLVRFADDFIIGFELEHDADRVLEVLPKRFGRFGLEIHPQKTRKVDFRKPRKPKGGGKGPPSPGSFDFLGFTHYWGKSRKGNWVVKRKTSAKRLSRTLKRLNQWLKAKCHAPVWWQHRKLKQSLLGHYAYFGLTGNLPALEGLYRQVERYWCKWLNRRSNSTEMTWDRFRIIQNRYPLPRPRIVHPAYRRANV
jgi:group II intron reverse transcriptase/maturase